MIDGFVGHGAVVGNDVEEIGVKSPPGIRHLAVCYEPVVQNVLVLDFSARRPQSRRAPV